jgi:hypothetical protein
MGRQAANMVKKERCLTDSRSGRKNLDVEMITNHLLVVNRF